MRFLLLLSVLSLYCSQSQGQTFYNKLQSKLGNYEVGFSHYTKVDSTRTYKRWKDYSNTVNHRPIPISLWYPAKGGSPENQLKIKDYLDIVAEEEEWEGLPEYFLLDWFQYLPRNTKNEQHFKTLTVAFKNAPSVKGSFPVIIYAPSYHASSIENFVICEYLASHGYIVISSPSRGTETRTFQGGTAKDMETQSRDILFLIQEAYSVKNTNTKKIATMGFSFGGLSNVLAQMQNERIGATICLDGSVKYQYDTLEKSAYFDIAKVDVPFLHMAQKEIPQDVLLVDKIDPRLNTEFSFYDAITKSHAYKMQFNKLTHSNFSSLAILFEKRDPRQDRSDPEIIRSYQWVTQYVQNFLDAYIKEDSEALNYLQKTPESNGASSGLISIERKIAISTEFSFNDFHDLAIAQDYKDLEILHKEVQNTYPKLEIPEGKLNYIGLQLSYHKHIDTSIRVYNFALSLYPTSANLFDSLAETYLLKKDNQNAILNFKRSLQLDPENKNAQKRLKQLNE